MPLYEHKTVKVTLIVEVDGHTLTFEETGNAKGSRYNGADPRETGYSTDDTLEKSVRGTVDSYASNAARRANTFLARAYPISDEPASGEQRG